MLRRKKSGQEPRECRPLARRPEVEQGDLRTWAELWTGKPKEELRSSTEPVGKEELWCWMGPARTTGSG